MAYSCKISSSQAQEYIYVMWGSQQSGYIVKVWFYDPAVGSDDAIIVWCDDSTTIAMIGKQQDAEATNTYVYRIGATWYDTGVAYSVGWHEAKFDYTNGTTCVGYLDGSEIFNVADPDTFNRLYLGNIWSSADGAGYFDDVDIGALLIDDFESCDLAGWSTGGSPECSNEQNHTVVAIFDNAPSIISILKGIGIISLVKSKFVPLFPKFKARIVI